MLYRTQRRLTVMARILAMPVLGMMLALTVSSTTAWAPAEKIAPAEAFLIVLN